MFTLADLVLATFADLARSIIGALLTPKRAAEYLHLAFGSKFPRLWSGTIVFTLALPFIVGAEDVLGGGSWFPWILVNMAISIGWLVAIWSKSRGAGTGPRETH